MLHCKHIFQDILRFYVVGLVLHFYLEQRFGIKISLSPLTPTTYAEKYLSFTHHMTVSFCMTWKSRVSSHVANFLQKFLQLYLISNAWNLCNIPVSSYVFFYDGNVIFIILLLLQGSGRASSPKYQWKTILYLCTDTFRVQLGRLLAHLLSPSHPTENRKKVLQIVSEPRHQDILTECLSPGLQVSTTCFPKCYFSNLKLFCTAI